MGLTQRNAPVRGRGLSALGIQHGRRDCHENLALAEGKSEELGLDSSRGRCPPIPEGFASEGAEHVAGNKMALDVEGVLDGGVNRQEAARQASFECRLDDVGRRARVSASSRRQTSCFTARASAP